MNDSPASEDREAAINEAVTRITKLKQRKRELQDEVAARQLEAADCRLTEPERRALTELEQNEDQLRDDYDLLREVVQRTVRRLGAKQSGSDTKGRRAEFDDLEAESLAHIWERLEKYDPDRFAFEAWVQRALGNKLATNFRHEIRHRERLRASRDRPAGGTPVERTRFRAAPQSFDAHDFDGWPRGILQRSLVLFVSGLDWLATAAQRGYDADWPMTTPWQREHLTCSERCAAYLLEYVENAFLQRLEESQRDADAEDDDPELLFEELYRRKRTGIPKNIRRHYWRLLLTEAGWRHTLGYVPTLNDESGFSKLLRVTQDSMEQAAATLMTPLWMLHPTSAAARADLHRLQVRNSSSDRGTDFVYAAWLDEDERRSVEVAKLLDSDAATVRASLQRWTDALEERGGDSEAIDDLRELFHQRVDLPYDRMDSPELLPNRIASHTGGAGE